jgi:hypothetical protein
MTVSTTSIDAARVELLLNELRLPMTFTAIDRLIHHATILEMNVESYRRKEALDRKRSRGRPPAHATPTELKHAPD